MTDEKVKQMLQSMVDFAITCASTEKPDISDYFKFRHRTDIIEFTIGYADVPEEFKTLLMEKIKKFADEMWDVVIHGRKDS